MLRVDFDNTDCCSWFMRPTWSGGDNAIMNKKASILFIIFIALFVVSATIFAAKAAFSINFTPLSGAPGDSIGVSSVTGDFEPLTTVGIGFGAEVEVLDEEPTITDTGQGSYPRTFTGFTANHPIKPGSFNWVVDVGGVPIEYYDKGDGTLDAYGGVILTDSIINYTSGFFSRTSTSGTNFQILGHEINYTTYELDVTPEGAATSASGFLIETMIVPPVPNGSYTVTAIDELGNVGTGTFQVVGSDIIPEPLTIGAIVLLSSTAMLVSFYWLRKRTLPKI